MVLTNLEGTNKIPFAILEEEDYILINCIRGDIFKLEIIEPGICLWYNQIY